MGEVFLRVKVGAEAVLFALDRVHEVLPMMRLKVSASSSRLRGVMNLRGALVPVFDVASADAPLDPSRFILVVPHADQLAALIVDDVIDLVEPERLLQPPGAGPGGQIALVEGEMLSVLDPQEFTL
ncbi:chemotaxis protein CheW [Myxococcota bacterium]|nr:chemotaxis protein CheW [Myxococcota bacterium]MBU1432837.1 chemotaxis protein CheW [Myxococcota bacterium]MBU1898397.1 chemotaxis protein CheW [Myxococcota bacterium]